MRRPPYFGKPVLWIPAFAGTTVRNYGGWIPDQVGNDKDGYLAGWEIPWLAVEYLALRLQTQGVWGFD
jgi:hypothetical protein